jgi:Flp pilus assembly protein TadD
LAKLQQDSSATMRIMTEAIEHFPTSSVLYQFRGEILMNFQQLDEAEEAYNKALELDPTNPNAYVNKVGVFA